MSDEREAEERQDTLYAREWRRAESCGAEEQASGEKTRYIRDDSKIAA